MFSARFQDLAAAVASCSYSATKESVSETKALQIALKMLDQARERDGIVYVIGNGGSAGIASHFATDLIKSLKIPAQTLYDSNLMTCLSNDLGYENVFSFPLEKLMKPADLLVAISSSGKSPNIIHAVEVARLKGASSITLSGFAEQNPLRQLGDLNFWVDQFDYGLVETAHFFLLHTIVDLWNKSHPMVLEHAKILRNLHAQQNQVTSGNY